MKRFLRIIKEYFKSLLSDIWLFIWNSIKGIYVVGTIFLGLITYGYALFSKPFKIVGVLSCTQYLFYGLVSMFSLIAIIGLLYLIFYYIPDTIINYFVKKYQNVKSDLAERE